MPENDCAAGIESIFYRIRYFNGETYEYYPDSGDNDAVDGAIIADKYDYWDEPDIFEYWWYQVNDTSVEVHFEEECEHELWYWAKDNVCNRTDVYYNKFYVDMTPPPNPKVIKEIGEPHAKLEDDSQGNDQWLVFPDTPICFNLSDPEFTDLGCSPCEDVHIEYRIWYMGEWTDWMEYTDCIYLSAGCVHYLEARAYDCLGNRGEIDNETFWVCAPGGDTGPDINIVQPFWGDEPYCDRTLEVIIDASDDVTPDDELDIILWIPGGRRDAPTLWYYPEYNYTTGKFHAFIDIYKYQNGAELTLMALAQDADGNVEFSIPVPFTVCSTIVWDQWMQLGWNSLTLPFGAIACDDSVESVLASVDAGNFDLVFYYDETTDDWSSYVYGEPHNSLEHMETGKTYWVHISGEAKRYYTDTQGPEVEILDPQDGQEVSEGPSNMNFWAFDIETEVTNVYTQIYNQTGGSYWDGSSWQGTSTWLECDHYGGNDWGYDTAGIWSPGNTYVVSADAVDKAGCHGYDEATFSICEVCE
ncbi:MAG: hypothetical protein JSW62_05025, partial [Thermoplasmatales archaeon]